MADQISVRLVDDILDAIFCKLAASDLSSMSFKQLCIRDFGGERTRTAINHSRMQPSTMKTNWQTYYCIRYNETLQNHTRLVMSPLARLPPPAHDEGYSANIHMNLVKSPDFEDQFTYAYRFVLSQTWLELNEGSADRPTRGVPRVFNVLRTNHPLITHVISAQCPRTWLCFIQTMEVLDVVNEGVIELGYRRLLECDSFGNPHENILGWRESQLLDRLLSKQQTLLLTHPQAIAQRVRDDKEGFTLARRYVYQNSKFFINPLEDETLPIYPWLGPLESVNNVASPCFGNPEICMVQCALGFSRLLVLSETGQIIHNFADPPHSQGAIRSSAWKKLLGIGGRPFARQTRQSRATVEYLSNGAIILGLPANIPLFLTNPAASSSSLKSNSSAEDVLEDTEDETSDTELVIRII
ncbi:hypothetical protein SmJEL517_g01725 [Synchytrium microbalum]|uniref:Uncharacterized protein n=1 Tax=Synchytrium microbalum TaxID=1806994 RepID=A0A507C359_9FUNG|nr:uncharacterized protein SmJEL517_g01725 [Synchytrium microbalum]TPX35950.1 hypothetical protein SmJEL517_g01725 [Synchytrium microbalum]